MLKELCLISLIASMSAYASAAQEQAPPDSGAVQRQNADIPSSEVKSRMNMDEPMQGGMMKKGMKKGDVEKSAEKKNEEMKKMLETEEKSMPAMPSQEPKM